MRPLVVAPSLVAADLSRIGDEVSAVERAGAALDPASPLAFVEGVLHLCDVVLVMTVNPGFGGQDPRAAQ